MGFGHILRSTSSAQDNPVFLAPYGELLALSEMPLRIDIQDHLMGFDQELRSPVLDHIHQHCAPGTVVSWQYFLDQPIQQNYPRLRFEFDPQYLRELWPRWFGQVTHRDQAQWQHRMCCFNHSPHVSRQLLVTALQAWQWFDPMVMSKHFEISRRRMDGHITHICDTDAELYHRLLLSNWSEDFAKQMYRIRPTIIYDHDRNFPHLEPVLRKSWLHLVSETKGTSYYPFITEKFLYSIVTCGLFVAYAQPGWHRHIADFFGFRGFTRIFDYGFDSIANPIHRLVRLLEMLSRFQHLSWHDLHDLYQLEQDAVQHNWDHWISGDWLRHLQETVA